MVSPRIAYKGNEYNYRCSFKFKDLITPKQYDNKENVTFYYVFFPQIPVDTICNRYHTCLIPQALFAATAFYHHSVSCANKVMSQFSPNLHSELYLTFVFIVFFRSVFDPLSCDAVSGRCASLFPRVGFRAVLQQRTNQGMERSASYAR